MPFRFNMPYWAVIDALRKLYPNHIITEEIAKPLIDLVKSEHINISGATIFPSTNYQPEDLETIKQWHNSLIKKK